MGIRPIVSASLVGARNSLFYVLFSPKMTVNWMSSMTSVTLSPSEKTCIFETI